MKNNLDGTTELAVEAKDLVKTFGRNCVVDLLISNITIRNSCSYRNYF